MPDVKLHLDLSDNNFRGIVVEMLARMEAKLNSLQVSQIQRIVFDISSDETTRARFANVLTEGKVFGDEISDKMKEQERETKNSILADLAARYGKQSPQRER